MIEHMMIPVSCSIVLEYISSDLEYRIDLMVYKLYGLSFDEVKIVDPDFRMSAKEYEKFELEMNK